MTRDLLFFLCGDDLDLVRGEADRFEAICSRGTNVLAVLSNAASENKQVHSAEQRNVRADCLAHGYGKDIQRKRGFWIVGA